VSYILSAILGKCDGFYWQGLDWNTGGLAYHQKIGAKIHEVHTSWYDGEALKAFGNQN
jgi:hypothetical protein